MPLKARARSELVTFLPVTVEFVVTMEQDVEMILPGSLWGNSLS